ncbi:MAG: hypothetical protein JXB32_02000 [Deltaproteobacteria bacterium]|nr:hypothetical protein [Deltaproteobacteria bacterium]
MRGPGWMAAACLVMLGGCQLSARDELRRHDSRRRPVVPVRPVTAADEHSSGEAAPSAAPGTTEGSDPAGKPADGADPALDDGRRRRMLDDLARLREAFVVSAKELVTNNAWGSIPELAARTAGQVSKVPDWHVVAAGDLDPPLREAAVHALVCRGLRDGSGACTSADALLPAGAALCVDAVRVLQQARALRQGLPFEPVAKAVGFPDDPALVQAARAALAEGNAGDCARLGPGPGEPSGWSEALCRVLAAGDPARCDDDPDPSRRAVCRGMARALLDTVGRPLPSPGPPLEEMYRRWSLGGDAVPECLAEPLAVLTLDARVQAVFAPETAALVPTP